MFLTPSAGAIKTIQVTFPAGTAIPNGAFFNGAEGIGPGTASKSGQTITYTVTNAVNVPAGTKIRLEFANINNPLNPSASYKVTVTTRNAANAIIDGPTQSTAYTMKQIGTNAIANNHITTPKIADGAVTTPKIADGAIVPDTFVAQTITSVPPGDSNFGSVICPSSQPFLISGGFITVEGEAASQFMHASANGNSGIGWGVRMYNSHPTATFSFSVSVTCMADMP